MDNDSSQHPPDYPDAETSPPFSGFMALVFTDLEGSSALSEKFESAFEVQREEHFDVLRAPLESFGGYEVETAGDSLFAVFPDAGSAARWSLEVQRQMQSYAWPDFIGEIKIRIGLHVGVPFIGRDKKNGNWTFRGPITNRAARLMAAAHGGQILLSQVAMPLISDSVVGIEMRNLGIYRLKGIGDENIWQLYSPGLRSDFPDIGAIPARRHNLPLPDTPFFGHATDLERWRALLLNPTTRLLTLCAFGGMGKTRSALQLGEDCALDFEDGLWWVGLENVRSRDGMLAEIAAALPFEIESQLPTLEQIQNFLRAKSLLLILDNIEQIEAAPGVVKQLLGEAPRLKILATTRHALQLQSEMVRDVPPLTMAESAHLFCERAAALGRIYQPDDLTIQSITKAVEGVPLALELSASLTAVLSPSQIMSRLDNQLKLLQSRSPDLPDRQRALRATMDWSFEMLNAQDQDIFARLSVFTGGFELEDAEAVTRLDDVVFSIQELHRRSLLRVQDSEHGFVTRYEMLESVRSYAQEQLAKNHAANMVRGQHAHYFSTKMSGFAAKLWTHDEAITLKTASLDFDNTRTAFRFLANVEHLAMAQLALVFGRVLQRGGHLKEAGERFQEGLEALYDIHSDPELYAYLQLERAGAHLDLFDYENAQLLAQRAFGYFAARKNARGIAESHHLMGLIALRQHEGCNTALSHFQIALACFTGIEKAMVLNARGLCSHQGADVDEAEADFNAALQLYRAHHYDRGASDVLTNLGVLAQERGDLAMAQKHYREALQLEIGSEAQSGLARTLSNVGEIELLLENKESAARILAAATHLFDRAGSPLRDYSYGLLREACKPLHRSPEEFLNQSREKSVKELARVAL